MAGWSACSRRVTSRAPGTGALGSSRGASARSGTTAGGAGQPASMSTVRGGASGPSPPLDAGEADDELVVSEVEVGAVVGEPGGDGPVADQHLDEPARRLVLAAVEAGVRVSRPATDHQRLPELPSPPAAPQPARPVGAELERTGRTIVEHPASASACRARRRPVTPSGSIAACTRSSGPIRSSVRPPSERLTRSPSCGSTPPTPAPQSMAVDATSATRNRSPSSEPPAPYQLHPSLPPRNGSGAPPEPLVPNSTYGR